ncbi:hypothetical protein [Methyloglobulus sp.]|uniref:hypothetical protein n=1 Tax=Methyloglobulus sp. TaxID=2518622 RepID=UPI0032B776FA
MVGKKVEPNSGLAAACGIGEFGVSAIPDAITPSAGRDLKSRPESLDVAAAVERNKKPWGRGNVPARLRLRQFVWVDC